MAQWTRRKGRGGELGKGGGEGGGRGRKWSEKEFKFNFHLRSETIRTIRDGL